MKLYTRRGRTCRRNITPGQQQVCKVECEEPHDAARQFFSPSYNLMLVGEIARHLPDTLAVLLAKCIPIWVTDNFQYCFADNLKSVTCQWRLKIVIRY